MSALNDVLFTSLPRARSLYAQVEVNPEHRAA
jgi:hypothetical protein